uniref:Uncharacterized protein n=1 Tax=Oryza punctata TaxID=4537 RepID=A0A0E0K2B6_ORYPU
MGGLIHRRPPPPLLLFPILSASSTGCNSLSKIRLLGEQRRSMGAAVSGDRREALLLSITTGEAGSATAMTEGSDGGGRVGADPVAAVLGRSSTVVKEVDPAVAATTTMTATAMTTVGLLHPPPLYRQATAAWASAGGDHGEVSRWQPMNGTVQQEQNTDNCMRLISIKQPNYLHQQERTPPSNSARRNIKTNEIPHLARSP